MAQRTKSAAQVQWLGMTVLLASLGAMAACGSRGDSVTSARNAPTAPVEFAQSGLVIDRLGQPVMLPVVVGSRPSPETIYSSDDNVVTVNDDGSVQAHRNGAVEIRTRGGKSRVLSVLVRSVSSIRIVPVSSTTRPGEEVRLRVMAGAGEDEIPPQAVVWSTSAPGIGLIRDGVLRAWKPGSLRVRAQYGAAEAFADAEVQTPSVARIDPPSARLRIGELRFFRLEPVGRTTANWNSTKAAVLASRGEGLFQAVGIGRARACGGLPGQEVCSDVEVVR